MKAASSPTLSSRRRAWPLGGVRLLPGPASLQGVLSSCLLLDPSGGRTEGSLQGLRPNQKPTPGGQGLCIQPAASAAPAPTPRRPRVPIPGEAPGFRGSPGGGGEAAGQEASWKKQGAPGKRWGAGCGVACDASTPSGQEPVGAGAPSHSPPGSFRATALALATLIRALTQAAPGGQV